MFDVSTPLSKLRAVNIVLNAMGEPSINSLTDAGIDAEMAYELLNETSRFVQDKGWHWNKENHTLTPDTNGFLNLPKNVGKVDPIGINPDTTVIQRGTRLFNIIQSTYVFPLPITVELIVRLPWEDLPAAAQHFITYSSAQTFQTRQLGSTELDKEIAPRATAAWNDLVRAETQVRRPNMLKDSWSIQSALQRDLFARGAYR